MTDRDILRSFGYDPDNPVPRDEGDPELTDRLLADLHAAPLVEESQIDAHVLAGRTGHERLARRHEAPTENELMVLRYISRGLTLPQAADALAKGLETVKTQVRTARYKLGAKTTAQACCEAIRRGLIP